MFQFEWLIEWWVFYWVKLLCSLHRNSCLVRVWSSEQSPRTLAFLQEFSTFSPDSEWPQEHHLHLIPGLTRWPHFIQVRWCLKKITPKLCLTVDDAQKDVSFGSECGWRDLDWRVLLIFLPAADCFLTFNQQVAFTGSTNTGRAVMKSAADVIKVSKSFIRVMFPFTNSSPCSPSFSRKSGLPAQHRQCFRERTVFLPRRACEWKESLSFKSSSIGQAVPADDLHAEGIWFAARHSGAWRKESNHCIWRRGHRKR